MKLSEQQVRLLNKALALGIIDKIQYSDGLLLIGCEIDKDNVIAFGLDSNPRRGIKDTAVVTTKNRVEKPLQEADSQYVIDNLETIYNTMTL